jgi:hypothetical protein
MICETDYVAPDGHYGRGRNRHAHRETGGMWWGPETRDPKAPYPFGDRIQPLSEEALNSRADILGTVPWRDRMCSPVMTDRTLDPCDDGFTGRRCLRAYGKTSAPRDTRSVVPSRDHRGPQNRLIGRGPVGTFRPFRSMGIRQVIEGRIRRFSSARRNARSRDRNTPCPAGNCARTLHAEELRGPPNMMRTGPDAAPSMTERSLAPAGPRCRSAYRAQGPSRAMRLVTHPQTRRGPLNRICQKRSLWDSVAPSIPLGSDGSSRAGSGDPLRPVAAHQAP